MDKEKLKTATSLLDDKFQINAEFIDGVIESIDLNKDDKVLDIGTGHGVMSIILALNGYRVITGEPADDHFADWQSRVKKVNLEHLIEFQPLNAEALPFEDSSFPGIFMYNSLHHVPLKTTAIQECRRVIKPNGIVCIIEFNDKGVEMLRKYRPGHPDAVDPRDHIKEDNIKFKWRKGYYADAFIFKK
jgi:ubiquinone/menaquinone biosynthesis C-methylase UbiE